MFQNTDIWQQPNTKITEETIIYSWLQNGEAQSSLQAPAGIPHWVCYGQADAQTKLAQLQKNQVQAA